MYSNKQIFEHALHIVMDRGGYASFFPPPVGGKTYDLSEVRYFKDAQVEIRYAKPTGELEIHNRSIDQVVVKAKDGNVYDLRAVGFAAIMTHFFSL